MADIPRVALGRTGLTVSALCQGTAFRHLERSAADPRAEAVLRHCLDVGVDIFDTAYAYGWGGSEALLGRVVQPVRDRVVLVTKVPRMERPGPDGQAGPAIVFTAAELRRRLEDALRRLRTDYVDVFLLHQPDGVTPPAAIVDGMAALVDAGLTRFWGVSNHRAAAVRDLLAAAGARAATAPGAPPQVRRTDAAGRAAPAAAPWSAADPIATRPTLLEDYYTIAGLLDPEGRSRTRQLEAEMFPLLRQTGLALLAFSPLDAGVLAPQAGAASGSPLASLHAAIDAAAGQLGVGRTEVCVAWMRAHPEVTCVLGGAESEAAVDEMLAGVRLALPAALRADLNAASAAYSAAVEVAGGADGRIR